MTGAFWYQEGLCRLEPGELDNVFPKLRLKDDVFESREPFLLARSETDQECG